VTKKDVRVLVQKEGEENGVNEHSKISLEKGD